MQMIAIATGAAVGVRVVWRRLAVGALVMFGASQLAWADVSGSVFKDNDADGSRDTTELGAPGVLVTAFDSAGAIAGQTLSCAISAQNLAASPPSIPNPIAVAPCAVGSVGDYAISGPVGGTDYRIEFSWSDTNLFAGAQGAGVPSSVQFVDGAATGVNFGVNYPEDYCQNNPRLISGCYIFSLTAPNFPPWSPARTDPMIVSWPYNSRFTTATPSQLHPHADDLTYGDLGHIFGITVQRATRKVFFGAISSPTWAFGALGGGGIYTADYTGAGEAYTAGTVAPFVDLDGLINLSNQNPVNGAQLNRFGEQGLGGMDFTEDDTTLWVVNMGNGRLVRLQLGNPPVAPGPAQVTEIQINNHGCVNGSFRPGAVETHRGKVYVGGVCDAATGTTADLRAVVLEYDGVSFTNRMSAPLNFLVNRIFFTTSFAFAPWSGTDSSTATQPFLSNLAFDDDGSLIVGLMPRMMYNSFAQTAGVMLRAQVDGSGNFTLENAGVSGPYTSTARTTWSGTVPFTDANGANPEPDEGPGNRYFFENGLIYDAINRYHPVLFSAGLTVVPGTGEIAAGMVDPLSIDSFGVRYFDRANGRQIAGLQFGGLKVALVTDVDAMCRSAPLELGNRVWCDGDLDGVQDPAELGAGNVAVRLQCGAANPVSTTTSSSGHFVFTDASYGAANSGALIPRNTACTVSIDTVGANSTAIATACGGIQPSPANNGGAINGADLRDSDGALVGSVVEIAINTGGSGSNDHSIDQGFGVALDFGDAPDSYGTTLANNGPRHATQAGFALGANLDAEADGQPTVGANGDDSAGTPDDEDGIAFGGGAMAVACSTGNALTAALTNGAGAATPRLDAWIDFNGDGDFDHPGEHLFGGVSQNLSAGANTLSYDVPCTAAPRAQSYARFRLSSAGSLTPLDAATNGEVEDYTFEIKGLDFGDAPDPTYPTQLASNGARHVVLNANNPSLGSSVDTEPEGQPSANHDGDDLNGAPDDEDGVVVPAAIIAGSTVQIPVTAGATGGALNAWIDFNRNGTWNDAGEQIATNLSLAANSTQNLVIVVPANAVAGPTCLRLRLSSASGLTPSGLAPDGEVEDYLTRIALTDWGDLPDTGVGTGAANYQTRANDNGANHVIVQGLSLGAAPDHETDGQPNANANGDDNAGSPDDEDGVTIADLNLIAGVAPVVRVNATNTMVGGGAATLCGFIDYNGDGQFSAGETAQVNVPNPSNNAQFSLAFPVVPANAAAATYARFRLGAAAGCNAAGAANDGEVEDYPVSIAAFDLGDLPDTAGGIGAGNYQTLRGDGGARHLIVAGLSLGNAPDAEGDGQPNAAANGDDGAGGAPDDEEGVSFPAGGFELGSPARATVVATNTVGSTATVCGFIDWNADGDFGDASETAMVSVPSGTSAGSFVLNFGAAPLGAPLSTYGRFRISTDPTCTSGGDAGNGEVEDYVVTTTGDGALSLGNLVWEDRDNDGIVDAGEPGIDGVVVRLFADANDDGVPDGVAIANQSTAGGGLYQFDNLLPGIYIVEVVPPPTYLGSTGSGRYALSGPYEPAPDPDLNGDPDNDDNGNNVASDSIRARPVTLTAKGEPVNDGDTNFNTNLAVDFGLVLDFDLALRKRLATGQSSIVAVGSVVNFVVTVYNQGAVAATQVVVADIVPAGMTVVDANWTVSGNQAMRTVAGPIAPGESVELTIAMRVDAATVTSFVNAAEIAQARDGLGVVRGDIDSFPDGNGGNDGTPLDDEIDNGSGDEDDHDIAGVFVQLSIPANAPWALALLAALALMLGARQARAIGVR
jgi:uncharacterized repeat protein (TIGR01451 family)